MQRKKIRKKREYNLYLLNKKKNNKNKNIYVSKIITILT
jgi:hypothetical protein